MPGSRKRETRSTSIRAYAVSAASVHDSQVFDELLDHTTDEDGKKRAAYADSAYRSKEQEQRLQANAIEPGLREG